MKILLKQAVRDFNSRLDVRDADRLNLRKLAKAVYTTREMKLTTKVQRISHLQRDSSGYTISFEEAIRFASVLRISIDDFNNKYILHHGKRNKSKAADSAAAEKAN